MPGPPIGMPGRQPSYGGPPLAGAPRNRNAYLVIGAVAILVLAATLSIVLAASNG